MKATPFRGEASALSKEPDQNGSGRGFLSINGPQLINAANGPDNKPAPTMHVYHAKADTTNLVPHTPHTYGSNHHSIPTSLQQTTQTFYTEPSPTTTTSIPYGHNLGYGANATYQATTADPTTSFNGTTNSTSTYYGLPSPSMAPNGNSVDAWIRWAQQQNGPIYTNQAPVQGLAQDYLNSGPSLVGLNEHGIGIGEATAVAATTIQQPRQGPGDTQFWPAHYANYRQGGPEVDMGPKMG
jgi:hypothetical protein